MSAVAMLLVLVAAAPTGPVRSGNDVVGRRASDAEGWRAVPTRPETPHGFPPTMQRAIVTGRDPSGTRLLEWRDQRQHYAVLWSPKRAWPQGVWRAYMIVAGRYQAITTGEAYDPRTAARPVDEPTLEDAKNHINDHWREVTGRRPIKREPSPTKRRMIASGQ